MDDVLQEYSPTQADLNLLEAFYGAVAIDPSYVIAVARDAGKLKTRRTAAIERRRVNGKFAVN
ncbi:hypothetical protein [Rathayibacter caricis]|uniref:hypothetical protein n=1 Tax=Rathayibacter caricis TaxID=110936 RepID=UPI0014742335|nr:hypothetical protein [Rathayibacter caricis]